MLLKSVKMKVWAYTTSLIKLNTYPPYFPPDRLGQLIPSLSQDDIMDILYGAMPNTWKKKMVEEGYNYLYGPIRSMEKFSKTRIKNLEKSIPHVFPQEIAREVNKGPRKAKL